MLDMMYELPSIPGLNECIITREVILNEGAPDPDLRAERAVRVTTPPRRHSRHHASPQRHLRNEI